MSTTTNPQSPPSQSNTEFYYSLPIMLLAGIVFLLIFGVTMAMFSFTYIQDMATLRNVPNLIWNFACGRPQESGVTLPLLLTISIVSFLGSAVLYGWRWWILRTEDRSEVMSE